MVCSCFLLCPDEISRPAFSKAVVYNNEHEIKIHMVRCKNVLLLGYFASFMCMYCIYLNDHFKESPEAYNDLVDYFASLTVRHNLDY